MIREAGNRSSTPCEPRFPPQAEEDSRWPRTFDDLPASLESLGLRTGRAVESELAEFAGVLEATDEEIFSPGDICPDNNLLTPDGMRLIDFEVADYHSIYVDAAYIRMPFASCWCVYRLPDSVAAEVETVYWEAARGPGAAVPHEKIRTAMAAWTIASITWALPRTIETDPTMHVSRPSATLRQVSRHRWALLAAEVGDQYPATAALMANLLTASESWNTTPLPVYPAFR